MKISSSVIRAKSQAVFVTALVLGLMFGTSLDCVAKDINSKKSKSKQSSQKSKSKLLEGGIKDEATLKPSLKVLPKRRSSSYQGPPQFYDGNVVQYAGGAQYSPGDPIPRRRRGRRSRSMFPTRKRRSHRIAPITDYHLTPRSGIMTYGGHGVIVQPSHKGITSIKRGYGVAIPRSHKGVTTFLPGYETKHISTTTTVSSFPRRMRHRRFRGNGISTFLPGYSPISLGSSSHRISYNKGISTWLPGYEVNQTVNQGGGFAFVPGNSVTKIASKNGVTAWSPGYQIIVNTTGGYKTSLGGKWYESEPEKKTELAANPAGLLPEPVFAQPVLEGPLLAKAGLLPQLKDSSFTKNITWKDWYRTVSSAIYSRWRNAEVGPGTAKVQVTVNNDRSVFCQVVDFFPAPYVDRNIEAETEFRVAALKAVNNLEKYEIPAFPPLSDKEQVQFEVMLKRTVDGPIGIDISKL